MEDHVQPLLSIDNLHVDFGGVEAVRDLSLTLERGQTLGVVGESGSGKSASWLAALGLIGTQASCYGSVRLHGMEILNADKRVLTQVRGRRIAIVFQDPTSALNPLRSIGWQIKEALRLHRGLSGRPLQQETERLLTRVGIADAARRKNALPHEMSGGQNQRVMIAMALAGEPEILVADEPTTALDSTIQAQILDLLRDIQRETGMALVLISHDLAVVSEVCDQVAVMYAGQIIESAPTAQLFAKPLHPYTKGLLAAQPTLDGPARPMRPIRGTTPRPDEMPSGCSFAPRCDLMITPCRRPQTLRHVAPSRSVACVRVEMEG